MQQLPLPERSAYQRLSKNQLLSKVIKLRDLYESGGLGGTSHEVHPGLDSGSTENYLYFTLVPAINFQRKSESLWRSALETYNDPDTRFVFNPAMVCVGEDTFRKALTKHGLALQRNKHTKIWFTLCQTLHIHYGGSPKKLLEECDYDVVKVLDTLKTKKKWFPYLSGPKLSNYWLFILVRFTDVQLRNKHEISIVPDVHITRATKYLGLLPPDAPSSPSQVAAVWKDFLSGTGILPIDLHAPLWRWSRRGFKPDL